MKITHITLSNSYYINYSYQENLLTKYHERMGFEVSIISSYNDNDQRNKNKVSIDISENKQKIVRLPYKLGNSVQNKLKLYKGLHKALTEEAPDIIFIHGVQFLDIFSIKRFLKKNPEVLLYIDNHADTSNSASNWVSKFLLHGIIWKITAKQIEPRVEKFYGVLPTRVDFLRDIYNLPAEKIELLEMGADDELINLISKDKETTKLQRKYDKQFVIVTGGKINNSKREVVNLMKAIRIINNRKIKLIIFGRVEEALQSDFNKLADHSSIEFVGWLSSEETMRYISISDLAIFPGSHSVLWEQVVALKTPLFVKLWPGTSHIDLGGNCKVIEDNRVETYQNMILSILNNPDIYERMLTAAQSEDHKRFYYSNIAPRSLGFLE